jgi:N-acetylglucosaminyldiphosphoundecaprenol N-acetyl-beta-D-mannosaminyltransferase
VRIELFGLQIDALRLEEAVGEILGWVRAARAAEQAGSGPAACRYVVTPNVNHAVLCEDRADFREAYAEASLIVADGAPLIWASRWFNKPLPERVAGSDLGPALLASAPQLAGDDGESHGGGGNTGQPRDGAATLGAPLRVFLLGAGPGVGERARARILEQYPHVAVVGTYSPPFGFERDPGQNQKIFALLEEARPDILFLGLGAPKQELWIHQHHKAVRATVALCIGATIDFIAGEKPRAPRWAQAAGLEWLHRVMSEPKRLAGRYARDGLRLPGLVWREWRGA